MDKDIFTLNNQTYSNNNNILLGIINDLNQIINSSHENLTIKRISDIIIKINSAINENKKNTQLIIDHITNLQNQMTQMNKKFDELKINNISIKEIKYDDRRYVGQVVNGLREGKGTVYRNDGDRYEGDFRNDIAEGKGIYYYNHDQWKGDRYEGDYRNGNMEGKGIYYYNNGDRYEGDWSNGISKGRGIYYYNNGDKDTGDYLNDKSIGKHILIMKNGDVKVLNY